MATIPISKTAGERLWGQLSRSVEKTADAVQALRDASAAAPTERTLYVELQKELTRGIDRLARFSTADLASIQAYVVANLDATADIEVDVPAFSQGMIDLRQWIYDNMPRHNGFTLYHKHDVAGTETTETFSVANSGPFRTEADTLLALVG